jgi:hypothetical protein
MASEDAFARLKQARERGDFAAVVAVLDAHSADARVQEISCTVLADMTLPSAESEVEAAAAGAIEAVVAALKAHVADARFAEEACRAVGNVTSSETARVQAAAAGAIEAVVEVLRMHPGNAHVQEMGCCTLARLLHGETGRRIRAGAAGAVEAVMAALRAHAANDDVAVNALIALHNLLVGVRDNKAKALGELDLLLGMLQLHPTNARVQEKSARALHTITYEPDMLSLLSKESVARIFETVLAALPGNAADVDTFVALLDVLAKVASHNVGCQNMAAAAGAMQDAVAALRSPPATAIIHQKWCYVLEALTRNNAGAQVAAFRAGAVESLLPMLRHPLPAVLRSACFALASIAGNTAAAARAGDMGAVETVITALQAHQSDALLQQGGCCALYFLAQRCAANMRKAHRAGAAAVAQAALNAHTANALLHARATALLKLLQKSTAAADAAMAALLAAEAAERAPPQKRKSKKKRGGSGAAAAAGPQEADAPAAPGGQDAGGAGAAAEPLAHGQDADDTVASDASPAAEPAHAVEQSGGAQSPAEQRGLRSVADVDSGANISDGGSAEPTFGDDADAQPLVQPAAAAPRRAPRPYRPPVGGASPCAPLAALQPPAMPSQQADGAALLAPHMAALALALGVQPHAAAALAAAACARSCVDINISAAAGAAGVLRVL